MYCHSKQRIDDLAGGRGGNPWHHAVFEGFAFLGFGSCATESNTGRRSTSSSLARARLCSARANNVNYIFLEQERRMLSIWCTRIAHAKWMQKKTCHCKMPMQESNPGCNIFATAFCNGLPLQKKFLHRLAVASCADTLLNECAALTRSATGPRTS